jgi:hypothetical protein
MATEYTDGLRKNKENEENDDKKEYKNNIAIQTVSAV